MVESLIGLEITRPDLSYPIRMISQFMQSPTVEHLYRTHRILRYVSGKKDRGLLYRHGIPEHLVGYTDVDWAGDALDFQSTSGFMFSLRSPDVAWSSKKLSTMALSSMEAEYRGAIVATYEAIWL